VRGLRIRRDDRAKVREAFRAAAALALEDAAGELLRAANETVPKEEGVLEDSGHVAVDEGKLVAAVGYGGEAKAYAVRQHEDTTLSHDGGQRAKWLELTFAEQGSRVGAWLAARMRGELS
jgi:hypothetical protein